MTEHTDAGPEAMDDLELITSYLNGQLDAERTAEVERRLDEDAAFRELAEPLFLTWSIPPYVERKPRPEGELEREWEKFVRRTGFGQQSREDAEAAKAAAAEAEMRRRRRRRSILSVLIGLFGVAAFVGLWADVVARVKAFGDSYTLMPGVPDTVRRVVPYDTGWILIGDSVFARLTPEAYLDIDPDPMSESSVDVFLRGTAEFRVAAFRERATEARWSGVRVRTAAGVVSAGESHISVSAIGDTTDVFVHAISARLHPSQNSSTVMTTVSFDTTRWLGRRSFTSYGIDAPPGVRTRIVKGIVPEHYRRPKP